MYQQNQQNNELIEIYFKNKKSIEENCLKLHIKIILYHQKIIFENLNPKNQSSIKNYFANN